MTNTIKSAIELAQKTGWRVFPANPKTKKPVFSGWQQNASADPSTIEQLFAPYSNAVIGLPDWSNQRNYRGGCRHKKGC